MAKILCDEYLIECTKELKVKVVELTERVDVEAIDIAEILGYTP